MGEYVETDEYFKLPQWRPLHQWTWQQVFDIHERHGVKPNGLYKKGMRRVGCMPCIMSNKGELAEIAKRMPEVFEKVAEAERIVSENVEHAGCTFWGKGEIPERYCSKVWVHPKTGETHRIPTAEDVQRYVQMTKTEKKSGSEPLFKEFDEAETWGACSSIYGLCE